VAFGKKAHEAEKIGWKARIENIRAQHVHGTPECRETCRRSPRWCRLDAGDPRNLDERP
jgi:hypothetical protein